MAEFIEAEDLIHFVPSGMGGEHTLCGDAFDLGSDEAGYEWKPTRLKTVTCPKCAEIIRACQGVRTRIAR